MKRKIAIYALFVALLSMSLTACNDKENQGGTTDVIYSTSTTSTLVTKFSLRANEKILSYLDSIHFTIDQEKAVIYNADSLPKGTKVNRLLTTVSFGSTISKAEYVIKTSETKDTTIVYSDSSTDSIDFTKPVSLVVTSADKSQVRTYRIMVNVHQEEPDTLMFPLKSRRDLPAAGDDNYAVGMTKLNDVYYSLTYSNYGRYMGKAVTPSGPWDTEKVTLPFNPIEKTLTASNDALYVLDDKGNLFTSSDAKEWTATGKNWKTLMGGYAGRVLGVAEEDGTLVFDEYPHSSSYIAKEVPADFPVSGASQLIMTANDWTISDVALLVGGLKSDGTLSDAVWGYDGKNWAELSYPGVKRLPALYGASLYSFYTYDVDSKYHVATRKVTWMVMGGSLADGKFNRTTYVSRDQGITWTSGASTLNIPDFMPSFQDALAFVDSETITANKAPMRVSKPVTEWDCPFVYLVGGRDANGNLLNNVWKGTISRMKYQPVY